MKYEFNRVRHTKRSLFFIGLIILIPMLDLLMNVQSTFGDYWRYPAAYHYHLTSRNVLHPAMAGFLSGSSIGHFAVIFTSDLFGLLYSRKEARIKQRDSHSSCEETFGDDSFKRLLRSDEWYHSDQSVA